MSWERWERTKGEWQADNGFQKYVHVLTPAVDVTLLGKRVFADVVKLRTLRWENFSGLSGGSDCNHIYPYIEGR